MAITDGMREQAMHSYISPLLQSVHAIHTFLHTHRRTHVHTHSMQVKKRNQALCNPIWIKFPISDYKHMCNVSLQVSVQAALHFHLVYKFSLSFPAFGLERL